MASKLLQPAESKEPELRIVLIGKTGVGKTSVKNTLLGRPGFIKSSASSQTTDCTIEEGEFNGQKLVVIDTPGVMNTKRSRDQVKEDIAKCITYAAPGPHVFLFVLKPTFTKYDKAVVEVIQTIFGKESKNYTLALFTCRDLTELEDEEIQKNRFISEFSVGHYSFDNTGKKPTNQVPELLEKINNIVKKNGKHYTSEMFEEAQKVKVKAQEMKKLKPDGEPTQDILQETVKVVLNLTAGEPLASLVLSGVDYLIENVAECIIS